MPVRTLVIPTLAFAVAVTAASPMTPPPERSAAPAIADAPPLVLTVWSGPAPVADEGLIDRPRVVTADPIAVGRIAVGARVRVDAFDDLLIDGVIDRVERVRGGATTYSGHLRGGGSGTLIVRRHGTRLDGIFRTGSGHTVRLRTRGDGVRLVERVILERLPGCAAAPDRPAAAAGPAAAPPPGVVCDTGATIDVLVVYTPLARDAAGGPAAIAAEVDLAVVDTNLAYAASGIATRIDVVHVAETEYDEVGTYNNHVFRLRDPGDGFMDDVHDLRDVYGADITSLFVADGDQCGAGFLMSTLSPDFEDSAFNVTTWFCAVNSRTFAHEIGHNLGCAHDHLTAVVPGLFEHSFGHRFTDQDEVTRRTIMALAPGSQVGLFSNPGVLFNGEPAGVPAGDPDAADNAATINATAFTVANFRCGFTDCNGNGVDDGDDLAAGTSLDCDGNEVPDECDLAGADCNANGIPDACDLASGGSADTDGNGVPDECEDCNGNGIPDGVDIAAGGSLDCDAGGVPDECDIAAGRLEDLDGNGIADRCEAIRNATAGTLHFTLHLALTAAVEGDVIEIGPGVYNETVDFAGRNLVLRSTNGPAVTILDGTGLGVSLVTFAGGEGPQSVLRGFTLRGAAAPAGAAMINFSSNPTIVGCVFRDNAAGLFGGGILNSAASPLIVNCVFLGNSAGGRGGALYNANSDPVIVGCTFHDNTAAEGGAIYDFGVSAPTIANSILFGDTPDEIVDGPMAAAFVTFSDVQGGWAGDGSATLDVDPLFVSVGAGNLRLATASPCADAGGNTLLPPDTADLDGDGDVTEPLPVDLDGRPRIRDDPGAPDTGAPAGAAALVDMGAYESPVCRADCMMPRDLVVDVTDLLGVLADWGRTLSNCDVDDDAVVGVTDLLAVLAAWGGCG